MSGFETQGTLFFWSSSTAATTSTSNLVGHITDFNGPGGMAAEIDVTDFDSTAKEYLIGLKDEGDFTMSLNINFADPGQILLRADRDSRAKRKAVVKFNDSTADASRTKAIFEGYVKGFSISGGTDDAVRGSATIRISGAVTYSSVISS